MPSFSALNHRRRAARRNDLRGAKLRELRCRSWLLEERPINRARHALMKTCREHRVGHPSVVRWFPTTASAIQRPFIRWRRKTFYANTRPTKPRSISPSPNSVY